MYGCIYSYILLKCNVLLAPYMLEPIIDSFGEEPSSLIKLQTLSTAMKLFFKRPAEMQGMLGRLLTAAVNDTNNQDLHDRALLYIRLLTMNINAAEKLFANCGACSISSGRFAENHSGDNKNKLFAEPYILTSLSNLTETSR